MAQSVLNFTPKGPAGITVTNTTSHAAQVVFTLYNINGTVATTSSVAASIMLKSPDLSFVT